MLVLLCSACWSVQGRVYRLRSAPSLEKGWSLSQQVLTHDETQHTAGEKETEQERERESESNHPSPPPPSSSSSSSSLLPPFPPCLPLTPHTPTRSGPRRHLWWAAASCWSRGRSSGRRARGLPHCGWPGPGAGPGAAGPSSRRRCASTRCIAAGRTLRRWRRTAAPGPRWSPRLSTATSAQRSAPRPGTVSERTSGGREGGRGRRDGEGKKKEWTYTVFMQNRGQEAYGVRAKEGEDRESDGARGGVSAEQTHKVWQIIHYNKRAKVMSMKKKFSPENKSLCFPHTHTQPAGSKSFIRKPSPWKLLFSVRLHVTASLTKLPQRLIHQRMFHVQTDQKRVPEAVSTCGALLKFSPSALQPKTQTFSDIFQQN